MDYNEYREYMKLGIALVAVALGAGMVLGVVIFAVWPEGPIIIAAVLGSAGLSYGVLHPAVQHWRRRDRRS